MHTFIVAVALAVASGGGGSTPETLPARHFVPDCRIILFGEVLDQVPSDDGKSLGALIERTEGAVLINGKVWVSTNEPKKTLKRTDEQIHQRGIVIEEAARQFRTQYKKVSTKQFVAGDRTYADTPQPFHVEKYGKTVDIAIKPGVAGMDYIYISYEGSNLAMPLNPLPTPSPEEQEKRRLDNAYQAAVSDVRAGTINFVDLGGFISHPLEKAEAFITAMHKVPSLAVPVAEDPFGEMAYRSLTVDGFFFSPQMVAVIMRAERGRER
jgi:hypothetical protein